jgi:hypothetical protein
VHKHLRRLERVWIDAPINLLTACTTGRRQVLAHDHVAHILIEEWRDAHQRHGWAIGRYVIMPDHVHFFCRQNMTQRCCPTLWAFGKVTRAGGSIHSAGRGRRPRLQRYGNANFLITFCARAKAIRRSGITSEITLFALGWSLRQTIGRTLAISRC